MATQFNKFVFLMLWFSVSLALADTQTALIWLTTQQKDNGAITSQSIGTDFQATAQALIALKSINNNATFDDQKALAFIKSKTENNTHYLKLKILSSIQMNQDVSAMIIRFIVISKCGWRIWCLSGISKYLDRYSHRG